jgi:hypothetical protein
MDCREIGDVVEDERAIEVGRPFENDLVDLAPGGAEPALAHQSVSVSPGAGERISTPGGASSRSWSGVPVRSPNVP